MCGRFALKTPTQKLAERFDFVPPTALPARYNIAPGQPILAVRQEPTGRQGVLLRWGLVPAWAKDPAIGNRLINARAETITVKPAYREAFRSRRCLIPADGFYEWQSHPRFKQPFYIHRRDGHPLALAGIWESWQDAQGHPLETCTILTTSANAVVQPIHDRMPVILDPQHWPAWLAAETPVESLTALLQPLVADVLIAYPVGTQVNRVGYEEASCLEPQDSSGEAAGLFGPGI